MATVEELVKDNTKDELVEQAEEYGLPTDGNKDDLAKRILVYEATGALPPDEDDAVDEPAAVEPDDDAADDDAADDVDDADSVDPDEDQVLLRFTGKAIRYELAGLSFGRDNPFRAVSEDKADEILESPRGELFRIASPKEARQFYA